MRKTSKKQGTKNEIFSDNAENHQIVSVFLWRGDN